MHICTANANLVENLCRNTCRAVVLQYKYGTISKMPWGSRAAVNSFPQFIYIVPPGLITGYPDQSTEPGCGEIPHCGDAYLSLALYGITQSILTQGRDSGCNSHNHCLFDQNNLVLYDI